jgi:FkbM family methyltransferase
MSFIAFQNSLMLGDARAGVVARVRLSAGCFRDCRISVYTRAAMTSEQRENRGNAAASGSAGSAKKIIYDFGANNGDDIPYYLKKADVVVAVEANPALCREIEERFPDEIRHGRLFVENCVVAGNDEAAEVSFYLHKRHHVLGQLPEPDASVIGDYTRVTLPSEPVTQILERYGAPYYIKIDIEGFDDVLLEQLFKNGIKPPYISAESQNVRVFALLVGMGGYSAFKLTDGETVAVKYKDHLIQGSGGQERYSFPPHSAGPFGDDVAGEWMNAEDLFYKLAEAKLGWKDIHATNLVRIDPVSQRQKRRQMLRHFRGWMASRRRNKS